MIYAQRIAVRERLSFSSTAPQYGCLERRNHMNATANKKSKHQRVLRINVSVDLPKLMRPIVHAVLD